MNNKVLRTTILCILMVATVSCTKYPDYNTNCLIGDDKKIDIKGSLTNGDMKNPNVEAGYWDKTVFVYFHDFLGQCVVSINNQQEEILFSDTLDTHPGTVSRFFMGDLPKSRYHLIISNDKQEAEGWFNNFQIVTNKVKAIQHPKGELPK